MNRDLARYWPLDDDVTFLNHGSYGATPWPVLHAQSEWRLRMEKQPVRFMNDELEPALDDTRELLGAFLGARPDDLAFVPNATTGVNVVLRSLELSPGDEVLTTDHDYNACINAIREVTSSAGATAVVAHLPFPVRSEDEVVDAILERAGPRIRLAVISHVTSPTALVLPVARLVEALAARGIDTLVDGAHAPGIVPLNLSALGAAYYTGNGHKWLCAPKGSGFLHVRRDRQAEVRPLVVSHGMNSPRADRSRFRLEFDWTGTGDPTPYLAISAALDFIASLVPGGWPEVMERNRHLALLARDALGSLGTTSAGPAEMIGSMAAVEIPAELSPAPVDPAPDVPPTATWPVDPLRSSLLEEEHIEVPVFPWPHTPDDDTPRRRLLRISAQLYNDPSDYERLAAALARRENDAHGTRHDRTT